MNQSNGPARDLSGINPAAVARGFVEVTRDVNDPDRAGHVVLTRDYPHVATAIRLQLERSPLVGKDNVGVDDDGSIHWVLAAEEGQTLSKPIRHRLRPKWGQILAHTHLATKDDLAAMTELVKAQVWRAAGLSYLRRRTPEQLDGLRALPASVPASV